MIHSLKKREVTSGLVGFPQQQPRYLTNKGQRRQGGGDGRVVAYRAMIAQEADQTEIGIATAQSPGESAALKQTVDLAPEARVGRESESLELRLG